MAVSPKQANKLILAQRYGTLSVTLCSSLENDLLADAGAEGKRDLVNPNDLLGLVVQPIPEPLTKTAQIWRGGKMEQLTFEVSAIDESLDTTSVAEGHQATPALPPNGGVGSQGVTMSKPGCPECEKKKRQQQPQRALAAPGATAANVPTLAPPRDAPSLVAESRFEPRSHGEVIYVHVEAEGAPPQKN